MKIVTDKVKLSIPCKTVNIMKEMNELRKKLPELVKTMITSGGIGMASNQIGDNRRYFIALTGDVVTLFINPTITYMSDEKETREEGCLSFPGIYKEIERSTHIKIKYFNGRKYVEEMYRGLSARIIQHEINHLDGISCLYLDNEKDSDIAS